MHIPSYRHLAFELLLATRNKLNDVIEYRWNNDPFGTRPLASRQEYLELWFEAKKRPYPTIDNIEGSLGYRIDRTWMDGLALHTQITKKKSELVYQHGRLLYSLLRRYLAESRRDNVTILETGTARGFSAMCMAKAAVDAGVVVRVITLDVLPHHTPQIWNCIDDHDGRKTRAQLLAPWQELLDQVTFLQGDTLSLLDKVGVSQIHFAFLDAQHTRSNVLHEFDLVSRRQQSGDIVFFDDVTPGLFDGVVEAVAEIEKRGQHDVRRVTISDERSYAWAVRR